jgi:hypothetical protein
MRQRLSDLQGALQALQAEGAADEDAWSDSSDDSAAAADTAADAAGPSSSAPAPLVETERERQIRLGLITPFQNVAGVATGVTREAAPAHAPTLVPAPLMLPSSQSAKIAATAKCISKQRREAEATRQEVKVMDPEELDEDMLEAVRKQEWFKRRPSAAEARNAADMAKAARRKRSTTLPRERRAGRASKRRKTLPDARGTKEAVGAPKQAKSRLRRKKSRTVFESDDDFSLDDNVSDDAGVQDRDSGSTASAGEDGSPTSDGASSSDGFRSSASSISGSDLEDDVADDFDDAGELLHDLHCTNARNELSVCFFLAPSFLIVSEVSLCGAEEDWYEWRLAQWQARQCAAATGNAAVRQAVLADEAATPEPGADATGAPAAARAAEAPALAQDAAADDAQALLDHQVGGGGPSTSGRGGVGNAAGAAKVAELAVVRIDGGFSIDAATYDRLFPYQQVGVKWMWELHLQRAGGAPLQACIRLVDSRLLIASSNLADQWTLGLRTCWHVERGRNANASLRQSQEARAQASWAMRWASARRSSSSRSWAACTAAASSSPRSSSRP